MTKPRLLALAAFVVVLVALGFIAWRHQIDVAAARAHKAEVAARRAQVHARLDALIQQQTHIIDIETQYAVVVVAYSAAQSDADAAMQMRHNSTDYDVMTAQAKIELANVNTMQGMLPTQQASLDGIADAYASVLGEGAVAGFRSDTDQLDQTLGLGLNHRWRAINDITDAFTNGTFPTENIEQLYDESSDDNTRAETQADELAQQLTELRAQLQARIDGEKRDLAAVTPTSETTPAESNRPPMAQPARKPLARAGLE